ncbi:hypothetical protein HG531_004585 [Fusarium graminearum]|nr:hypothetical protein HG531_004585 [Fusarium graminearum]
MREYRDDMPAMVRKGAFVQDVLATLFLECSHDLWEHVRRAESLERTLRFVNLISGSEPDGTLWEDQGDNHGPAAKCPLSSKWDLEGVATSAIGSTKDNRDSDQMTKGLITAY